LLTDPAFSSILLFTRRKLPITEELILGLPGSECSVRCCHCDRPLRRFAPKCPTCLTRQLWWRAAAAATFLLSLLWLFVFGIPLVAE
jgi:hypothetical protein